ncbi:MAG TPA: HEPN domain-containing protein [Daejeonella sp.]
MENNRLPNEATELVYNEKLKTAREIIAQIFNATNLKYMRMELWLWFKSATDSAPWSFLGNPSIVLSIKEHLMDVMTAARALLDAAEAVQTDLELDDFAPFSEAQTLADRVYMRNLGEIEETYKGKIRRLTLEETEEPLLAIKRFFIAHSFEEWTEILTQLMEYALSKTSICEATGEGIGVGQYELLEGLIEAIYLIYERDDQIPSTFKKLKKTSESSPIVDLIIASLEPEMIFQVTHPNVLQDGADTYRDLLIVLPDSNATPFQELEPVVELITAKDGRLSCSLHKASAIQQALNDGHIYYSLVCIKENLIYQNTTAKIPDLPAEKFAAVVAKGRQEFEAGMAKAHSFYAGAEKYAKSNDSAMTMFMLQQATELTFRAVALSLYGIERRTHSIKSLKKLNRRLASQLNDIFPADTDEEERLLKVLEDAYLEARYLNGYTVAIDDLQILLIRVGQLMEITNDVFSSRGIM